MTEEQVHIRDKARQTESFNLYMDDPQTRFMMSMIPAGENKDALVILLESAFASGFKSGGGNTAVMFLEAMFRNRGER